MTIYSLVAANELLLMMMMMMLTMVSLHSSVQGITHADNKKPSHEGWDRQIVLSSLGPKVLDYPIKHNPGSCQWLAGKT